MTATSIPKCFISYSWDSALHCEWVRKLASDLVNNGVSVFLDQWDMSPGHDLTRYMETSIRESDYVLLICTPEFTRKANESLGGVGYEKAIVTGELFQGAGMPGKFVPVLRLGEPTNALPSYLKSKLLVDLRPETVYDAGVEEILRHLHKAPRHPRPALGGPPDFLSSISLPLSTTVTPVVTPVVTGADIIDVVCERCGATPGKPSKCPSWMSHRFVSATELDYCSRCGTHPTGHPTSCPGWVSHAFVKGAGNEFCGRCGAQPTGTPTKCPGWTSHAFVAGTGREFCQRCGVSIGKPTACPGWTSHSFVTP